MTKNYKLIKKIKSSYDFEIFLAENTDTNQQVIIKTTKDLYTNEKEQKKLQNEYNKLITCNNKYIIEPKELIQNENRYYLVFEYFKAKAIKNILQENKISINNFLNIAIKICEAVLELHNNNIIHTELNSNIILLNRKNDVKLTNLTYAIFENENIKKDSEHLDVYKAPEQTYRINSIITKKTDIYSLGIIFYEMLSGIIPFNIDDLDSLSHSIVTKEFIPLDEIDKNIPKVLSNIVKKMLQKNPQDRYSDILSILVDLKKMTLSLQKNNSFEEFNINQFKKEFQINNDFTLYGREKQLKELVDNLNLNSNNIIFVTGNSGVGKTSFVKKALKNSNISQTNYLEIKFDNYKQNIPYKILYSNLRELSKQLLTKDRKTLLLWKNKLLNNLGDDIDILFNIIPELKVIVGDIKQTEKLSPTDTKIKIDNYLFKYIQLFATKKNPLVIFIEDIQWVDTITINWIENVIYKLTNIHLIITSRDNQKLNKLIQNLEKNHITSNIYDLKPLNIGDIKKLIDTNFSLENSEEVSKLIYSKTSGNALFINQFLKKILENEILYFNYENFTWQCDTNKILTISAADNIIELLENRITQLTKEENKLLKIASTIGNKFEEELLKKIFNNDETFNDTLKKLILNEWILKTNQKVDNIEIYCFSHDRIQQVLYSLIKEEEKKELHKKIGHTIIELNLHEKNNDFLTYINHFNKSKILFKTKDEKEYLATLNYNASLKARENGDFINSKEYMQVAIKLFGNIEKRDNYNEIVKNIAICEHLILNKQEALKYYKNAIENSTSNLEKAYIYELIIKLHTDFADFDYAYATGREALKLFNLKILKKFNPFIFLKDLLYLKYKLRNKKIYDLLLLKTATDEKTIIIIKILSAVLKAAYQIDPRLCVLTSMQLIKICLNNGLTKDAATGFMVYGIIFQGAIQGNHEIGYEYSQLSLDMIKKYNNMTLYPQVSFVCGYFSLSWNQPTSLTEQILFDSYSKGLIVGDLFHSGCAAANIIESMFLRGVSFDDILSQIKIFETELEKIRAKEQLGAIYSVKQSIKNLQGKTQNRLTLSDELFNEESYVKKLESYKSLHFAHYYYINKMIVLYFHKEYAKAYNIYTLSQNFLNDSKGTIHCTEHYFYESLILSKLYEKKDEKTKKTYLKIIKKNLVLFEQYSKRAPENFFIRKEIIKAEVQRIEKKFFESIKSLEYAIKISEQYSQINLKILANRLLNDIYSQEMKGSKTSIYLKEEEYKDLNEWGIKLKRTELNTKNNQFEINTLTKVAEIIVKEQKLPVLLKSLLNIIIENASAQYAVVLIEENEKYFVEAAISTISKKTDLMQHIELKNYKDIVHDVINFVLRTKKHIIIDDLTKNSIFFNEQQAVKRDVKSILCLPLTLHNKIKGIIYLENNALTKVFTKDKIKLLRHLSGQIAISIENATIYKNLEKKVQERTKDLDKKNIELENQNITLQKQNSKILELNSNILKENEKRKRAEAKLQEAISKLDLLATTDSLTNLKNRRVFDDTLELECRKVKRSKETLSLIMCDIDYFKLYNDFYGHLQGDECLKYVAKVLKKSLKRPGDLVARYGGEEFGLIMPNTSRQSALIIAKRIKEELSSLNIIHKKSRIDTRITLSMGLATSDDIEELSVKNLIYYADSKLYEAKNNGRNQIL